MRRLLLIFVLSVVTIVLPVQAQFEFGMAGPELNYKNTIETDVVHANTSFRAAAHFTLSSGWHVNSNAPMEEYLIATELRLKEVPGFTVEGVAYPRHSVYTFEFSPDQEMAVYGEVFTIGLLLHADETLTPGSYELVGVLHYQACNDSMCAPPGDLEIVWTVTVVETSAPLKQVAPDWFMQVNWADAGAVSPESLVPVSSSERVVSDGNWRELVEEFNIAGLGGFSNTAGFLEFIDKVEAGKTTDALAVSRHWWVMLLLVLGGGILLNLTPCVLPLMPINIAIIGAGAHAGSRRRGFALGSAYGLGIALVYGALGLLVVLGMSAAFGTLNSTAWFNAVIALLFVLLSLAMFDIVEIDFSKYQAKMGLRGNSGGHFLVALGMGAVSALLAGACVAPVVIYTILQAQDLYSQGN
ncbi:MAG: hypothetical protein KAH38_13480, partial [Candidatus Hydrogenedentes bacterium]|nr:hypothetical protein [Candidatus Hydrogenedentota bacterium]